MGIEPVFVRDPVTTLFVPMATDKLPDNNYVQLLKLMFGSDGAGTMVDAANPLPSADAAVLAKAEAIRALLAGGIGVTGPLTDAQLAARGLASDTVLQAVRDRLEAATLATGTINGNAQEVVATLNNNPFAVIYIQSTAGFNLQADFALEIGGIWTAVSALSSQGATTASLFSGGAATSLQYIMNTYGATRVRVRTSAYTSGSMVVSIQPTRAPSQIVGPVAQAQPVTPNPVQIAFETRTTKRNATTDGTVSRPIVDTMGRQVMTLGQVRELQDNSTLTLTTTTETTLIAAVASIFNDIRSLVISNTSATGVRVDFRDSTAGTIRLSVWVPATSTIVVPLSGVLKQATVNTNWTAQLSAAVTDVRISAVSERM